VDWQTDDGYDVMRVRAHWPQDDGQGAQYNNVMSVCENRKQQSAMTGTCKTHALE